MSDDDDIDYYAVLELTSTATPAEIKKAYYKLCRLHHPDRCVGQDKEVVAEKTIKTQKLNDAYEVLSDELLRANYDQKRANRAQPLWDISSTSSSSSEEERKGQKDHEAQKAPMNRSTRNRSAYSDSSSSEDEHKDHADEHKDHVDEHVEDTWRWQEEAERC